MQQMIRTSEFWVSIACALGQAGVIGGWWTQDDFNTLLKPALVYVAARVTSKVAKSGAPKG